MKPNVNNKGAVVSDIQSKELVWVDTDFNRVQQMIHRRAGISLHDGKHAMVYSRLSRRLRETGHESFNDYLDWVESSEGPEWQEFINALTTNLTSFFREHHHYHILRDHLLSKNNKNQWNLWCCAASTGEEPYSILITMLEALGPNESFKLIASDIDSKVLSAAAQGIYRLDGLKNISDSQLHKFFLRGRGQNSGMARIKPEVRRHVEFMVVNLIANAWPFNNSFDIVFCRNVMIYFDNSTQRQVLERIHRVMVPGGLLFVGHAENFNESRDLFVLRGKTVYERV